MKAILLALLATLFASMGVPKKVKLPDDHPLVVRAASCADDVVEVTKWMPENLQAIWAPIVFVYAEKEGGCHADPTCPEGTPAEKCNDNGRACGVMQTWNPEWEGQGITCKKVRKSRKLGMYAGLHRMLRLASRCGSIGAGLHAYETYGQCPKNSKVILQDVRDRLKLAGGIDPATPWPPAEVAR